MTLRDSHASDLFSSGRTSDLFARLRAQIQRTYPNEVTREIIRDLAIIEHQVHEGITHLQQRHEKEMRVARRGEQASLAGPTAAERDEPTSQDAERTDHCPRCGSPAPDLHPAVQSEGDVRTCAHPFHKMPTNQKRIVSPVSPEATRTDWFEISGHELSGRLEWKRRADFLLNCCEQFRAQHPPRADDNLVLMWRTDFGALLNPEPVSAPLVSEAPRGEVSGLHDRAYHTGDELLTVVSEAKRTEDWQRAAPVGSGAEQMTQVMMTPTPRFFEIVEDAKAALGRLGPTHPTPDAVVRDVLVRLSTLLPPLGGAAAPNAQGDAPTGRPCEADVQRALAVADIITPPPMMDEHGQCLAAELRWLRAAISRLTAEKAQRDESLSALIVKWRERAGLNAMPPGGEAHRWPWKNVGITQQQCVDELLAALSAPRAPNSENKP